jgi:hypothetical protein
LKQIRNPQARDYIVRRYCQQVKPHSCQAQWFTEVGIRRITVPVPGQPRQKSYPDSILTKKLDMVVHACHPTYSGGHR